MCGEHLRPPYFLETTSCVSCYPVVFGELVWSATVLALSTDFKSCIVTVLSAIQGTKNGFQCRPLH
jgi:hypothetical protein